MQPQFSPDKPLPRMRQDLQLFKGPDDGDGSPTYNVYDPVRVKYFKISWAEAAILMNLQPGMTPPQLIAVLEQKSTLRITINELESFFVDAARQGLIEQQRPVESLLGEVARSKLGPVKAFLLYYLFFRIPLVNPDAFLARTLDRVRFLLSSPAVACYLLICFWGLAVIVVQWEAFFSTFTYFFNASGFIAYVLAIICTKIVHEFAHAYTAKKYGLRIPTMGIAFLVLFPVLYTDVTEGWKLASKKKRMAISAAGLLAESTIAGVSSILWAFSEPGIWQSVFFILASANWISTLLINLNPALRFDGYYLLMDWLGVENLQTRAFNVARCAFYRVFLGMPIQNPEPKLSKSKQRVLTVYAIYTFLYRVILYTAIALFVYYKFTKTVGIFLFLVEILLFFIWPVVSEIGMFRRISYLATFNERSIAFLGFLGVLVIWTVIPWPHTLSFPATTLPVDAQVIYVPADAKITNLKIKRHSPVKKGDLLVGLTSVDLTGHLNGLKQQAELTRKKMEIASESDKLRPYYQEKQAELARAEAEADTTNQQIEQLQILSNTDGYVFDWDQELSEGQFVGKDQPLGRIASDKALDVVCYVPERDVETLEVGQQVLFQPRGAGQTVKGIVKRIAPVRADYLEHPELASLSGGPLPVSEEHKGERRLLESYFPVVVSLEERDSLRIGEEGFIKVRGPWMSYLGRFFRFFTSVLWREGNV